MTNEYALQDTLSVPYNSLGSEVFEVVIKLVEIIILIKIKLAWKVNTEGTKSASNILVKVEKY